LNGSSILIADGTGSFGHTFLPMTLEKYNPKKIVIFTHGEIYVKKILSIKETDVTLAVDNPAKQKEVGIRLGEKLHEQMIGSEDSLYTYEYPGNFKILPSINNWSYDPERIALGKKVDSDFIYSTDKNDHWMEIAELQEWIGTNKEKIGST
jgi:UDP-N-acetylglucosamine 4,6-dehydratase/5-epimerase